MVGKLITMDSCKVIHIGDNNYIIVIFDRSMGKVFISKRTIDDSVNINEFMTDFCMKADEDFHNLDLTQDIIEY
ncbi:MAG: hypothetical protein K0S47_568 [Herbinix sp.]|jgi:hypothetical protein|nr:hypothetical protein [Herbinix sp.]